MSREKLIVFEMGYSSIRQRHHQHRTYLNQITQPEISKKEEYESSHYRAHRIRYHNGGQEGAIARGFHLTFDCVAHNMQEWHDLSFAKLINPSVGPVHPLGSAMWRTSIIWQ